MKKLLVWTAILCSMLYAFPDDALAQEEGQDNQGLDEGVSYWLEALDADGWQRFLDSLPQESRDLWSGVELNELIGDYASDGASAFDFLDAEGLSGAFAVSIKKMAAPFLGFIALALLSALMQALSNGASGVSQAGGFALRAFSLLTAITLFVQFSRECSGVIDRIGRLVEISLPPLTTILTAVGRTGTAGAVQTAAAMLTGVVAKAMQAAVIPLAIASGVLGMLDEMNPVRRVGELSKLMRTCAKWIVGVISTVFMGSSSIKSLAAASFDGVTVRTAKYALSQLVPVVGGMVSGTMETVLGGAQLVKNAAGMAAILLAVSVVLPPILRLAAGMLLFRIAGAISQPIADERLPKICVCAGDSLNYLIACMISMLLMCVLLVIMVLSVNLSGGGA